MDRALQHTPSRASQSTDLARKYTPSPAATRRRDGHNAAMRFSRHLEALGHKAPPSLVSSDESEEL